MQMQTAQLKSLPLLVNGQHHSLEIVAGQHVLMQRNVDEVLKLIATNSLFVTNSLCNRTSEAKT